MDKHVVSLDLAKNLKKLGFRNDTISIYSGTTLIENNMENYTEHAQQYLYPAPLATELLEELPRKLELRKEGFHAEFCLDMGTETSQFIKWFVGYVDEEQYSSSQVPEIFDDSMTNALAKLWIYLKENNLL
jgi:hypothetical protein